jgi:hypothetical protein
MRAVGLVLRARLRQYWKSWLVLGALVALVGGLVMAAAVTGRRTAAALPAFTARYGYDAAIFSPHPLARASLPEVSAETHITAPFAIPVRCSTCRQPIDQGSFAVFEVPPARLGRTLKLMAGRLPDQSDPGEVLASYSLAQDNGVRIGSVIRVFIPTKAEAREFNAGQRPRVLRGPQLPLRVVGLVVAERELPVGTGASYDLYPTAAFARRVNPLTESLSVYYVHLRRGAADFPALDSRLGALHTLGADDTDVDTAAIERSVRPQAVGWWILAGLAALAGLAVIGQAGARQVLAEEGDREALAALGLNPRQLAWIGLARAAIIGLVGAAGAVILAVALSPLTPVGVARLAAEGAGDLYADPLVLPLGALATVTAVVALSVWPVLRVARRLRAAPPRRPASVALVRAAAGLGAPPSVVLGLGAALERGRGRQPVPVGTALLGMAAAVAALCATAVFGASLGHLTATPALYGVPYQAIFSNEGSGSGADILGLVLPTLTKDPLLARVSTATVAEISVNGQHVRAVAVTAAPGKGPALIAVVDGRRPRRDQEIMLGATTMRSVGARPGGLVTVTVADPDGHLHASRFRVVGRSSFSPQYGTGGLGTGSIMTIGALIDAQCPPGSGRAACRQAAASNEIVDVLARAAPGPAGTAALARYARQFGPYYATTGTPLELVNFGEAVNFPLLFGFLLSLFGAATMIHLLLVSVARRRTEAGLLKVLGLVRYQVAAVVAWQATAVAVTGIVIGVPLGIAAGRLAWRLFAVNLGVVPVSIASAASLAVLAVAVLAAANLLAFLPALLAARSRPAQLLRAE